MVDCLDGSDENITNFQCYDYELSCSYFTSKNSKKIIKYNRCISYEMLKDGKIDCDDGTDEMYNINSLKPLENCTHPNLFLCLDQSRCLPKSLKCNKIINCIDGSDEIESCENQSSILRYFLYDETTLHDGANVFVAISNENYARIYIDAKSIEERTKKIVNHLMFGLKCNSNPTIGLRISKFTTVPQPKISSNVTYCHNQEDRCFDKNGKLLCFRCFDGTIIQKSQVCDGIIDCQDLSDECTCENCKVKPLCDMVFNENISKPNKYGFKTICNLKFDFPGNIDEIYCSNKIFYPQRHLYKEIGSDERIKHLTNNKCARGETAFNRTLHVVPGNNKLGERIFEVFPFWIELIENPTSDDIELYDGLKAKVYEILKPEFYPSFHQKALSTLSNLSGSCDDEIDCPYREDECSPECFAKYRSSNNYFTGYNAYKFIRCFSFLFENLEVFSLETYEKVFPKFHLFFNNSVIGIVYPRNDKNYTTKITYSRYVDGKLTFTSYQKSISFNFSKTDIFKTCKEYFLNCPWYFRCESNKYELINIKKVCDFNLDCKDESDEKYCSDTTHFNCTLGSPVSIDKGKVNDNKLDCADHSDECNENPISSIKEMIKSNFLRNFIWITLTGIILLNFFVITKTLIKIKASDDKHSTKYYNLVFILNLSISDIIFGFILSAIAISSYKFSGSYCSIDFEWRSSLVCNTIGALTLMSSQTSLNILVLMTGFRLYSVYKPFKALDINKRKIYMMLAFCWINSFLLSITPIVFKKEFMQNIMISKNIFLTNKFADRIIKPNELNKVTKNIENVWNSFRPNSIPTSKSFLQITDFNQWYFNSKEVRNKHPNTNIDVKMTFGFYTSSSVCLPDFYADSAVASSFTFVLMSFNLFLVLSIIIGYVFIFYKVKYTKSDNISKNKSKKENKISFRVFLIVATDLACWLPIILFSFANYFKYPLPEVVHSLTSIVLLPINSLLNPVLYSEFNVDIVKKFKNVVYKLRNL